MIAKKCKQLHDKSSMRWEGGYKVHVILQNWGDKLWWRKTQVILSYVHCKLIVLFIPGFHIMECLRTCGIVFTNEKTRVWSHLMIWKIHSRWGHFFNKIFLFLRTRFTSLFTGRTIFFFTWEHVKNWFLTSSTLHR